MKIINRAGSVNNMEKAKRYKGVCPICGKVMWICKSILMEMGINVGSGTCPDCETFLHITFNPEREEMDLERFEDYQERHCKEREENAKANGEGSGI